MIRQRGGYFPSSWYKRLCIYSRSPSGKFIWMLWVPGVCTSIRIKGWMSLFGMFSGLSQVQTRWKETIYRSLTVTLQSPALTSDLLWIFYLNRVTQQRHSSRLCSWGPLWKQVLSFYVFHLLCIAPCLFYELFSFILVFRSPGPMLVLFLWPVVLLLIFLLYYITHVKPFELHWPVWQYGFLSHSNSSVLSATCMWTVLHCAQFLFAVSKPRTVLSSVGSGNPEQSW